MENTQNETTKISKMKGIWDNLLSDIKSYFTLEPGNDNKFSPPQKNELLSSIETRLNRHREELSNISKNGQTEKV